MAHLLRQPPPKMWRGERRDPMHKQNERRDRIAKMVREAIKNLPQCAAQQAQVRPCQHALACPQYTPAQRQAPSSD